LVVAVECLEVHTAVWEALSSFFRVKPLELRVRGVRVVADKPRQTPPPENTTERPPGEALLTSIVALLTMSHIVA
jgi:hypothetical protein